MANSLKPTSETISFNFRPASREQIRLLIGLAGPSGSGKTYTGMRLAKGLCGDKPFALIDTENRRGSMYADQFRFDVCDLSAPYRPDMYAGAIETADKAGYGAIVVDSMSHEHAGEGGVLDWQEEILDELVSRAIERNDPRPDWQLEEAYKRSAWIEPKAHHKRLIGKMLQCRAHLIFCLRAEDKIDFVKDEKGKTKVVPMETLSGFKGWIPICDKRFLFELTTSLLFLPDHPGVPIPIKLSAQHKAFFPLDKPITEDAGRLIGEWAKGGTPKVESVLPPPRKPPIQEVKPGVVEPVGQAPMLEDAAKWFTKIEQAATLETLNQLGVDLARITLSEDDKATARQLFAVRKEQLKKQLQEMEI